MKTSGNSVITCDHDEVRRWAEDREAKPTRVTGTGGNGDAGLLRLDFPGFSGGERLEEISWEEFFEKFDREELCMVYQEDTAKGDKSNFNKIIPRKSAEAKTAS